MALLAVFQPLKLRSGHTLRSHRYVSGQDARGIVYTEPDQPLPGGADRKFTKYIEGNGTPRSYLLASILTRELLEFGATRHGCWWSLERLLGAPPPGEWTWIEAPPSDWSPAVQITPDAVSVTFYTHTTLDRERITKYTDTYEPGQYTFVTDGAVIACRPTTSAGPIHPRS